MGKYCKTKKIVYLPKKEHLYNVSISLYKSKKMTSCLCEANDLANHCTSMFLLLSNTSYWSMRG